MPEYVQVSIPLRSRYDGGRRGHGVPHGKGPKNMPNWCDNRLTITGEDSILAEFAKAVHVKDDEYCILNSLLPFPPSLEGEELRGNNGEVFGKAFSDRGYNWCLANWGCKWSDNQSLLISEKPGEIEFYLTTPWGPPGNGIINISRIFHELTFLLMFHEDGMAFAGGMAVKNGKIICEYDDDSLLPQYDEEADDPDTLWDESLEKMYSIIRRRLDYGVAHVLA